MIKIMFNEDLLHNYQPDKKATLATKTEQRAIRREKLFLAHLREWPKESWVGIGEAIFLITLGILNFWLLLPFFGQEDTINYFSAPLVPFLAEITSSLVPFGYGIRLWLLIFNLIFPFAFYFWVREVMKRKIPAAIGSLLVSLPSELFLIGRVKMGLFSGDGGQIACLGLILGVCLSLLKFIRQGGFNRGVIASIGVAIVALTSPLGVLIMFGFALVITFSEFLLGEGRLKLIRLLTIVIFSAGFVAFWYHPGFIWQAINSPGGQLMKKTLFNLLPMSFFIIPVLATFGYLLFDNRPQLQPLFMATFLTIGYGLFSFGAGIPLTTPSRFLPAFGVALAFLVGVLMMYGYDFLRQFLAKKHIPEELVALAVPSLVFCLLLMVIVLRKEGLEDLAYQQVLGLASTKKTGIWALKQESNFLEKGIGYGLTAVTLGGTVVLKRKLRKI